MASEADSYELAVEQYVYWRELGLSNVEMLAAVGLHPRGADDDDTIQALAYAHHQLKQRRAA